MLLTILDHRGYGVLKTDISPQNLSTHKKNLTYKPTQTPGYDFIPPKKIIMYQESKLRIWLPKIYGRKHFGTEHLNKERQGTPIDTEFGGTLKPNQEEILNQILPKIQLEGGGCICLPTGFGKTVCAIWLACKLGVKTLWVTHKTNLMEQTRERFVSFTGDSTGTIQQDRIETDHPFVIGMLQSIAMKDYDPAIFDTFGLVIFDEAHHVPSHVFSKCLWKLNTKYMIGLSATLERKDNLHDIIGACIGPVLIKVEAQLKIPVVRRIKATYHEDNKKTEHVNCKGKPDTAKIISDSIEDSSRNKTIIEAIYEAYKEGRTVLVLSERISHCNYLKTKIATLIQQKDSATEEIGLYIGGRKNKELIRANECKIIVATYNMCSEGYDNPLLNTVVFATSKRDVRQSAGRVLGLRSGGGFRPLIIDIYDTWGNARNQSSGRLRWYKESSFDIEGVQKTTEHVETFKRTPFSLE